MLLREKRWEMPRGGGGGGQICTCRQEKCKARTIEISLVGDDRRWGEGRHNIARLPAE